MPCDRKIGPYPCCSVVEGDCLELMKALPDGSVDAVITDPPYGLEFMGKEWDAPWKRSGTTLTDPSVVGGFQDGNGGNAFSRSRVRYGRSDMHGFEDYMRVIFAEALRAAKPGAMLLAFGGTRTFHRLACAIEDAGWEIRDCIMWVYGSGFPKSLDVSKAIDKAAGALQPQASGFNTAGGKENYAPQDKSFRSDYGFRYAPATEAAKEWAGWGTALKPAWEPVLLAMKPIAGTFAENVQRYGTGALNIDGCRIGYQSDADKASATPQGLCTNMVGRLAGKTQGDVQRTEFERPELKGRWPANVIHDGSEEVLAGFPETTSGEKDLVRNGWGEHGIYGSGKPYRQVSEASAGSAARFFYCAKASRSEREAMLGNLQKSRRAGLQGADSDGELDPLSERWRTAPAANNHPTVKPLALMEYLVKLVCRPGALVLDPFLGSGTTGMAARKMDCHYLGMDLSEDYCRIARERIALVEAQPNLFAPKAEQLKLATS